MIPPEVPSSSITNVKIAKWLKYQTKIHKRQMTTKRRKSIQMITKRRKIQR
jgi:hypothetical protein